MIRKHRDYVLGLGIATLIAATWLISDCRMVEQPKVIWIQRGLLASAMIVMLISLLLLIPGHSLAETDYSWYHEDSLARELCKLTEEELAKFTGSELVDVSPVLLPYPEHVIGVNDYFDWPVATRVNDTIIVLYDRRGCHWGCDDNWDSNSGIRMIIRSTDGGRTWSEPFDLRSVGKWAKPPFRGWCGGLGAKDGVVYVALNFGLYRSTDEGATWELVENPDLSRIPGDTHCPGMRLTFHPDKGLVIWTTDNYTDRDTAYGKILRAVYSPDYGRTWYYEDQSLPD